MMHARERQSTHQKVVLKLRAHLNQGSLRLWSTNEQIDDELNFTLGLLQMEDLHMAL